MRLDRWLTLYLFGPLWKTTQSAQPCAVPVLMYHGVSDAAEDGVHGYYRVNTAPAVFRQQMAFLKEQQYRVISLDELLDFVGRPSLTPRPPGPQDRTPVVITFDDGFEGVYREAFPVLCEYGFTATVFLPTASIGHTRRRFQNTSCLTWSEITELHRHGITFGSHTVTHPKLRSLPWREVESEIRDSKQEIEQHLGAAVRTFAHPYAYPSADAGYVRRFADLLRTTGYACNATTEIGRVHFRDDPYRLRRLPVNGLDDPRFFKAKLEGGYDWLGVPQAAFKRLRTRRCKTATTDHV